MWKRWISASKKILQMKLVKIDSIYFYLWLLLKRFTFSTFQTASKSKYFVSKIYARAYLRIEWFYLTSSFVTNLFSKSLWASKSFKKWYQRMYLSKISIICILWYDFLNNLDPQKDFDKKCVTKKLVKYNHSYL